MRSRLFLIIILIFGLGIGGLIQAQEEAPPAAPPEAPTELPTEIPTESPTDTPVEAPAEIPTEIPTEAPTDIPVEAPAETPTETPTDVPATPPVVHWDASSVVEVTAGVAATIQFTVSDDEAGLVRVGAAEGSTSAGVIDIAYTDPAQAEPPFNTGITLTYSAPADFAGIDSLQLKAVDPSGLTTYFTVTVNVIPAPATLEPTLEPTSIPDQVRIINYNPAATEEAIQAMLAALGAVEVSRIPQIGAMKVQIPQAVSDLASASAALSVSAAGLSAGLMNIEPEIVYYLDAFPNDPYFPPSYPATTAQQWV